MARTSKQRDENDARPDHESQPDPEMDALGDKLKGYEKELSHLEARRNSLVTSHQPEPKVDQMKRDLDNQATGPEGENQRHAWRDVQAVSNT